MGSSASSCIVIASHGSHRMNKNGVCYVVGVTKTTPAQTSKCGHLIFLGRLSLFLFLCCYSNMVVYHYCLQWQNCLVIIHHLTGKQGAKRSVQCFFVDHPSSKILFPSMLRLVCRLKVHMHIRPLHIWQTLQFELQFLRNIVGLPERLIRIHDNVHLGDQTGARVVHANGVDLLDGGAVRAAHVRNELLDLHASDHTDKQQEFGKGGAQPDGAHNQGDEDSTHGIDPPSELRTTDGSQDTETVDEQIVAMILPENEDLRVFVLEHPGVEEQRQFGAEGTADGDDGRQMEVISAALAFAGHKLLG